MSKHILAMALAASLALTSLSAAPARADEAEFGRFMLGAGALLLLGHVITRNNRTYNNQPSRNWVEPNHVRPVKPRRVLPATCLRHNYGRYGPRQYFGRKCLRNFMHHAGRLPGSCQSRIRSNRGYRTVYGAHCLRRHGWVYG